MSVGAWDLGKEMLENGENHDTTIPLHHLQTIHSFTSPSTISPQTQRPQEYFIEHHRTPWNLMEHSGNSWNIPETNGSPWNMVEGDGTSWKTPECSGTFPQNMMEPCGKV